MKVRGPDVAASMCADMCGWTTFRYLIFCFFCFLLRSVHPYRVGDGAAFEVGFQSGRGRAARGVHCCIPFPCGGRVDGRGLLARLGSHELEPSITPSLWGWRRFYSPRFAPLGLFPDRADLALAWRIKPRSGAALAWAVFGWSNLGARRAPLSSDPSTDTRQGTARE